MSMSLGHDIVLGITIKGHQYGYQNFADKKGDTFIS